MARRLAENGAEVVGYDIDPTRLASLASDDIRAAGSPAEAADGADVLAVMVATPAQVSDVMLGPEAISAIAARAGRLGVGLVDAPVSGGVARVA
jgi:3-hydroxyisobutyrate dehydrogenase